MTAQMTAYLTDLLGGILILPMVFILMKRKQKRQTYFFACLCVSCLLGFVTHNYCTGRTLDIMWIFLYAILFETVNAFFLIEKPDMCRTVHLICLPVWAGTAVGELFHRDVIRILVLYALVFGVWGFVLCAKRKKYLALCSLVPLLPAAYFQMERKTLVHIVWDFDYNGLTHIFIILSVFVLFAAARREDNHENQGKN